MHVPPTPLKPGARPGVTVAEVMVAALVLSVALTGASFAMTSAFGTYRNQDRTLQRQALVHDQMELLAGTPYTTLKGAIAGARRPTDPLRDGVSPTDDFQSVSGGEAIANYELEPPPEGQREWKPKAKPPASTTLTNVSGGGKAYTPNLEATMRLQYWDPQFDQPTLVDKGLIRAKFTLSGDGLQSEAVRYVTR